MGEVEGPVRLYRVLAVYQPKLRGARKMGGGEGFYISGYTFESDVFVAANVFENYFNS